MLIKNRITSLLENFLFSTHLFVLILVFADGKLQIPSILEVFGRVHPLILHFPIVLLLIWAVLTIFSNTFLSEDKSPALLFLLAGLNFTALTVISGLFLSTEAGYIKEDIRFHQWAGLILFWCGSIIYYIEKKKIKSYSKILAAFFTFLIILTGHLGASLTHGEDFLLAPLMKAELQVIALDEAIAFEHIIKPILDQKCVNCHNGSKKKGDLRLDHKKFILEGGENGPAIDTVNIENSLILQNILLPLHSDGHMPPKGKPQLTEIELSLIKAWIEESALFEKKLIDYPDTGSFFKLASTSFNKIEDKKYFFPKADNRVVNSLNNFYRKITPKYPQSPALVVNFYGKSNFDIQAIKELDKIKDQVIELNLNNMPLKDEDLSHILMFKNLEKLNLNFTGIKGTTLGNLKEIENLKSLSISGNTIASDGISQIQQLKQLKHLYAWGTGFSLDVYKSLENILAGINLEKGFIDEGVKYKLNPPKVSFERQIFTDHVEVNITHPLKNVKIYYTDDDTLPDSSNFKIYDGPIKISNNSNLRARAFAEGWLGSAEVNATFYKTGFVPDNFELVHSPDPKYKGNGASTLFDLTKGDLNFGSGKWLGFQKVPCEVNMKFNEPKNIQNISFSLLTDEGSYIFPPKHIEISVKDKAGKWKVVRSEEPEQPKGYKEKSYKSYDYKLDLYDVLEVRAIIKSVYPLPKWHQGAGQYGWVFIDEIFIN
jgi:hypothetical protein